LRALFVDTSALAKRYLSEPGAVWMQTQIEGIPENIVVISELGIVEMFSLLVRREKSFDLSPTAAARLRQAFLVHVRNDYLVIAIDASVLVEAREIILRHRLKALDAIQLVCGQRARQQMGDAITFVTADRELLTAAAAEGFATDNPNDHL
jgi:predicted nucleic acid-binding protein